MQSVTNYQSINQLIDDGLMIEQVGAEQWKTFIIQSGEHISLCKIT